MKAYVCEECYATVHDFTFTEKTCCFCGGLMYEADEEEFERLKSFVPNFNPEFPTVSC